MLLSSLNDYVKAILHTSAVKSRLTLMCIFKIIVIRFNVPNQNPNIFAFHTLGLKCCFYPLRTMLTFFRYCLTVKVRFAGNIIYIYRALETRAVPEKINAGLLHI